MTAVTLSPADLTTDRSAFTQFLSDVWVLTKRSLARIRREPETLSDVTIQPVMFVLMSPTSSAGQSASLAAATTTPT